jgi:hypothetical protein
MRLLESELRHQQNEKEELQKQLQRQNLKLKESEDLQQVKFILFGS